MGTVYEREHRKLLQTRGWLVNRGTGSMGMDLIAIAPVVFDIAPLDRYKIPTERKKLSRTVFIECKSTERKTFNFSDAKEQYHLLKELADMGHETHVFVRWKKSKIHRGTPLIDKTDVFMFPLDEHIKHEYPILRKNEGHKIHELYDDYSKHKYNSFGTI